MENNPFLFSSFISGYGYKNDPDLLWLNKIRYENPHIYQLIIEQIRKWRQYPEIQKLCLELYDFFVDRRINRYGFSKKFKPSQSLTPQERHADFHFAQKLFRKRFEEALKKYGI